VPKVDLGTLALYRHQESPLYKMVLDHLLFHGVGFHRRGVERGLNQFS